MSAGTYAPFRGHNPPSVAILQCGLCGDMGPADEMAPCENWLRLGCDRLFCWDCKPYHTCQPWNLPRWGASSTDPTPPGASSTDPNPLGASSTDPTLTQTIGQGAAAAEPLPTQEIANEPPEPDDPGDIVGIVATAIFPGRQSEVWPMRFPGPVHINPAFRQCDHPLCNRQVDPIYVDYEDAFCCVDCCKTPYEKAPRHNEGCVPGNIRNEFNRYYAGDNGANEPPEPNDHGEIVGIRGTRLCQFPAEEPGSASSQQGASAQEEEQMEGRQRETTA